MAERTERQNATVLGSCCYIKIGHSRGTNYRRPPLDECCPNVNVYIYNIATAQDVNVQTTFTLPLTLPFAPTMLKALSLLLPGRGCQQCLQPHPWSTRLTSWPGQEQCHLRNNLDLSWQKLQLLSHWKIFVE